jgi:hypothetical protein
MDDFYLLLVRTGVVKVLLEDHPRLNLIIIVRGLIPVISDHSAIHFALPLRVTM